MSFKYRYNYERPIPLIGGHPGCAPVNAGWGWNWKGRERATGRERTYYARTSYGTKAELKDAMEHDVPGIIFIDGAPADKIPSVVFPLPPHSFQHGIMEIVERELGGHDDHRSQMRTLPPIIKAIPIKMIPIPPAIRIPIRH